MIYSIRALSAIDLTGHKNYTLVFPFLYINMNAQDLN